MKRLGMIAMLLGLALLVGLVIHEGAHEVADIIGHAGMTLLWLVPLHALPLALDARAWQTLLEEEPASLAYLTWVAAVREAVNRLLPAANIGGEVVGIRLGALAVQTPGLVPASVIVEVLLTIVAQYLLCAGGVVLTMVAVNIVPQQTSILLALLVSLPVPIGLFWGLRHGSFFTRLEAIARRIIGDSHRLVQGFDGARLDACLRDLIAHHGRLARALCWQLLGMLVGCAETWLALFLLGHCVTLTAALSIEALSLAIRSVVFFVPGGLGVQDAGIVLLGHLFGIDADIALSLALVKRMREILFGAPALISWHWLEARRLRQLPTARTQ